MISASAQQAVSVRFACVPVSRPALLSPRIIDCPVSLWHNGLPCTEG